MAYLRPLAFRVSLEGSLWFAVDSPVGSRLVPHVSRFPDAGAPEGWRLAENPRKYMVLTFIPIGGQRSGDIKLGWYVVDGWHALPPKPIPDDANATVFVWDETHRYPPAMHNGSISTAPSIRTLRSVIG